ncbi:hypothetical protein F5884DRAFT_782233 [Xylogone sp. PMI_703]|nr:hypothetical protein F5884DRAFT_782233 [Xylogone sp. PMI_703]
MRLMYLPSPFWWLFPIVLILVSFAQADVRILGYSTETKPQPIGIDFGAGTVFAMYAHSRTNVTSLGAVIPNGTDNQRYIDMISVLQQQNEQRTEALRRLLGFNPKTAGTTLLDRLVAMRDSGKYRLSEIKFKAERYLYSIFGDSITIPTWLKTILMFPINFIVEAVEDLTSELLKTVEILSQNPLEAKSDVENLTGEMIKQEFTTVLESLQLQAYEKQRLRIDSAVVSVPDYLNYTVRRILQDACRAAGISTTRSLFERTMAAIPAVDHRPDSRMLVLDHGFYHLTISTLKANHDQIKNPIQARMVPFDTYGSYSVDYRITMRLKKKNKLIQEHLGYGADPFTLMMAVRKARLLMKDNLDAEVLGLGVDEDHHHDEWPLDLDDWWIGYGRTLTLQWEEVKAVEDNFVEGLKRGLSHFLIALGNGPTAASNKDTDIEGLPQQEIDTALILTDQPDGGLIRRAVREVVGDHVPIRGGYMNNITLAAEGAAIMAFRRGEQWEKVRLYDLGFGEEPVCDTGL